MDKHNCDNSQCCILREPIPGEFDGTVKENSIVVPKRLFKTFKEILEVELIATSGDSTLEFVSTKKEFKEVTLEFYI